jgi:hypothetical protein
MLSLRALTFALSVAALGTACAPSICARKDTFFRSTCSGASLSYTGDPMCETYLANCTPAQLAQAEGYVACLEETKQCSAEALSACQAKFPGGVNLMCTPLPAP